MNVHIIAEDWATEHLPAVRARLDSSGLAHTFEEASLAQIPVRAEAALQAGRGMLVALGNDATAGAIAQGIVGPDGPLVEGATIGVLPVGECGIARTFGLPLDPVRAVGNLRGDAFFELDVGLAACRGSDPVAFLSMAEAGLGARLVRTAERLPTFLGRTRRFVGFWAGVAHPSPQVEVLAGRRAFTGSAWGIVVGNCQFLQDLRLSPRSFPGDGVLDVLAMTGTRSAAFRKLPQMYSGEHVPDDTVVELRAEEVSITTRGRSVPVQADGIWIGETPARFSILRQALRLKV